MIIYLLIRTPETKSMSQPDNWTYLFFIIILKYNYFYNNIKILCVTF